MQKTSGGKMKTGIELKLTGQDGNAFMIFGLAKRALKKAGKDNLYVDFQKEATSGDYDHLLQTCMKWFDVI